MNQKTWWGLPRSHDSQSRLGFSIMHVPYYENISNSFYRLIVGSAVVSTRKAQCENLRGASRWISCQFNKLVCETYFSIFLPRVLEFYVFRNFRRHAGKFFLVIRTNSGELNGAANFRAWLIFRDFFSSNLSPSHKEKN